MPSSAFKWGLRLIEALLLASVTGAFTIEANNLYLTTITMPALTSVRGRFSIWYNQSFSTCAANALLAQLLSTPPEVHIVDHGACP